MGSWNSLHGARKWHRQYGGQSTASSDFRATFTKLCYGPGNGRDPPCGLDRGLQTFADLVETRMREYEVVTSPVLDALWGTTHPGSRAAYLDR